ncbi:MAG: gamma-glutamyltransferase [Alphaproteobacteria bacterium]
MWRQLLAAAALGSVVLAACSPQDTLRGVGLAGDFRGGVSGDEPRAVLVARDVLSAGGSAADAAVALYFAAAVTYPSSAALGGGGACLVFDPEERKVEALEFPAVAPQFADAGASPPNAVPGAVRGMFALHARYGRLQWSQLLAPAEEIARLGHPVSRALARDIGLAADALLADPAIARVFGRGDGTPLREGDELVQLDLAAVLTLLRTRGPGAFYSGDFARKFVAAAAAGGALGVGDLRGYQPVWRETLQIPFGFHVMHTLASPTAGGVTLLQMWAMLTQDDRYEDADADERAHLLAEVSMRAIADRGEWLPRAGDPAGVAELVAEDRVERLMASYRPDRHAAAGTLSTPPTRHRENPAGTSFVVIDGEASAVACTVTLNNLFGIGRVAPGTGVILAAAPSASQPATASIAPVMVVNHNTGNFYFAAAASGGAAAPSALVDVMAGALVDGLTLSEAVAAPRLHHDGVPDAAVHEPGESELRLTALRRRGYALAEVPKLGRVNVAYCSEGFKGRKHDCLFVNDPRGHGLATAVHF